MPETPELETRGPEHVPGGLAVGPEEAGADHIHRTDAAHILLHMQSSMAVGKCSTRAERRRTSTGCSSPITRHWPTGVGGANPTHTGQALALRTAEHVAARHFGGVEEPIGDVP